MIWLTVFAAWAGFDFLLWVIERGTGFKTTLTFGPLNEWRLLGWSWQFVRVRRNDEGDQRLYQNKVEDQGFAVMPLCFKLVVNRVKLVEEGHGPIVLDAEERERLMNQQRRRAPKGDRAA